MVSKYITWSLSVSTSEMKMLLHHSTINFSWGFLIKYWIPTLLTVVLLSEFRDKSYNPYEGYPWGYLTVGILWFSMMVILVILVAIWPQWMTQKADETAKDDTPTKPTHASVQTHSAGMSQEAVEMGQTDGAETNV